MIHQNLETRYDDKLRPDAQTENRLTPLTGLHLAQKRLMENKDGALDF